MRPKYLQLGFLNSKLDVITLNLYSDLEQDAEYSLEKCSKISEYSE